MTQTGTLIVHIGPLPDKEILRAELHADGRRHARYPSASMTLCARPVMATVARGRPGRPTCLICRHVAREWDRIDGSAPAWWFKASGGVVRDSLVPLTPPEELDAA